MEPASMLTQSTHSVTRGSAASHLSRSLCVTRDECHEADSDHPCPRGQTPDQADDGADVSHEQTSLIMSRIVSHDGSDRLRG